MRELRSKCCTQEYLLFLKVWNHYSVNHITAPIILTDSFLREISHYSSVSFSFSKSLWPIQLSRFIETNSLTSNQYVLSNHHGCILHQPKPDQTLFLSQSFYHHGNKLKCLPSNYIFQSSFYRPEFFPPKYPHPLPCLFLEGDQICNSISPLGSNIDLRFFHFSTVLKPKSQQSNLSQSQRSYLADRIWSQLF